MVHTCGALKSEEYLNTFYKIPSTNSIFCCWYSSDAFCELKHLKLLHLVELQEWT